jgi:hypothetical protein
LAGITSRKRTVFCNLFNATTHVTYIQLKKQLHSYKTITCDIF